MMKRFEIIGGKPLSGEVEIFGAKNAINKQLVLSLLTKEPCTFHNVPRTTEVQSVLDMVSDVGAHYEWIAPNSLTIQTTNVTRTSLSQKYSGINRIPVLFFGPLLHRAGEVEVPFVGGCNIGPRPVDFHLSALRALGAEIESTDTFIRARATELQGALIHLPFPSVGATENILFSSCVAQGTTVITNAAIEPEIIDTILCLQKMGARIHVDVDRRIVIEGVRTLNGLHHTVIPDRMEAVAFAVAAIATQGRVWIRNARQDHLMSFLNVIRKMGASFDSRDDGIEVYANRPLDAVHVQTDVHPGFMTDWQQPLVVALTQAVGASVIHETMYEDRFGYTDFLREMGAQIELSTACLGNRECRYRDKNFRHSAVVIGATRLKGQSITIPDLRAGFASICAALVADGKSTIYNLHLIERGHPDLLARLQSIGTEITEHFDSEVVS